MTMVVPNVRLTMNASVASGCGGGKLRLGGGVAAASRGANPRLGANRRATHRSLKDQ
jgi:hypothetical protein